MSLDSVMNRRSFCMGLLAVLLLPFAGTAQQYASQARGLGQAVVYQNSGPDHVNL